MLIVSALQNPPLFIEGVPRRGGGVTSVARSKKICIIYTPHFVWKRVRRPKGKATPS